MAKHGYEALLLPGEELMYKIQGVYDISQHHINTIGTLYITTFQSFFVDDAKEQLKYTVPHGCVASLKKYKNQNTNNVPLTDKSQYVELRCKDLRSIRLILPTASRPNEVRRYLEFVALPENVTDSYAFMYNPLIAALDEGWYSYDPLAEYKRIGLVTGEGGAWRVSEINNNFILCPTYPEVLVVPSTISDKVLEKVGDYRSKARIPVCVWKHPTTHASISRCSQPLVGLGRRSEEDEMLLRELQRANKDGQDKTLYIIDARPKVNAAACTLSGGGTEIIGHYSDAHANLEYCGIANIHVVRESFKKLGKVCRTWDRKSKWSDVTATHWLEHISSILVAACRIATYVDTDGCSVLVHCTDGWDRTSQLCALAEILMDPYYRTIHGFVTLICKEFVSFGHKFSTRNGNVSYHPRSQGAPIFVQFLDCVWQLTRQFPTSFEFSENLLLLIISHLHSQLFGTFLCDNEAERATVNLTSQSGSLWGLILHAPPAVAITISNSMYSPHSGALHGNGNLNSMQLWRGYYHRCSLGGLDESQAKKEKKEKKEKEKKEKKEKKGDSHDNHTEEHTEDHKEENHKDNKEENGTNGTHTTTTNGEATLLDPITIHEAVLVPYLDTLNEAERAKMRKDLKVWLAMGGGRGREKARLQLAPRRPLERKESRFGTMRVSSHNKKDKHSEHEHDDDEGEGEGEDGIKRGKSFSSVFARMTGTLRGEKGRGRASSSAGNSDQDDEPTTTTTHTSNNNNNNNNNNSNNNSGGESTSSSPNTNHPISNGRSNLTEDDPET